MKKLTLIISTFIFLATGILIAQKSEKSFLELDDYFELESVSSPAISPDGSQIIYSRGWINKYEDRSQSDLWIMNADGTSKRFFLDGSSPVWSPDGKSIAFTREGEPRGTQIFVKHLDIDGPPTQITRLDERPSGIQWSPDGKFISFTMLVPDPTRWPVKMPARPQGANWTAEPRIIDNLVYRRDRVGFVEEGFTHIFIVPFEGGTARQVTHGSWDHGRGGYSWTRDGREILFSGLRVEDAEYEYRESEIYAVNVENGEIRQLTTRKGPDGSPVVSPDNRLVVYTGYDWSDDA